MVWRCHKFECDIVDFLWAKLQDFKSYRGKHVLDLRKFGPGLYYIRGTNKYEPDLGSNGCGKSTIWDAVHWCFYGSSLRAVKSPNLAPWGKKGGTAVTVCLRLDGSVTKVKRTYKPNSLAVIQDGQERGVTQEQLEDLLRLNSERFQQSIIFGQHTVMFFDLTPGPKLDVFTDLMNLNFWLERSEHAKHTVSELTVNFQELEHQQLTNETRIEELTAAIAEDEAAAVVEAQEQGKRLDAIRDGVRALKVARDNVIQQYDKLGKKADDLNTRAKTEADILAAEQEKIDAVATEAADLEDEAAKVQTEIAAIDRQIARIKQAKDICPTCGQKIDNSHLKKELARLKADRAVFDKQETELATKLEALEKRHDYLKGGLGKARSKCVAHQQLEAVEYEILQCQHSLQICDTKLEGGQRELKEAKNQTSAYAGRIQRNRAKLAELAKTLKKTKKQMQELEPLIAQAQYWVKGFKDVRLFEIDEALQALEVEVNNYLTGLGMENWTVKFAVERETKSGSVSRGLQVFVDPGTGKENDVKPWESWSGGEGQRLRLAGALGLANLILRQRGIETNIQVWDEKLYWLSGTGEEDMLQLLQEQAKQNGKQVWVIDQHARDYPFDGVVDVIKDRKGSRIEL